MSTHQSSRHEDTRNVQGIKRESDGTSVVTRQSARHELPRDNNDEREKVRSQRRQRTDPLFHGRIMTSIMTKPEMYAAFPEPVSPITGKSDVQELIQILQHLIFCAQSCKTPPSLQNFLFLTLPENIWTANTGEQYPVLPNPPPPIPNYEGSVDSSDRATTKSEWELNKKTFD